MARGAERRADEDGTKYTLAEFKDYYGAKQGQKQWDWAAAAPAPKAKAKAKVKAKAKAEREGPRKPRVDPELLEAALKEATSKPAQTVELIAPICEGVPEAAHFRISEAAVPEVPEGGLLLQLLCVSPDPYMRGGMKAANGAKAGQVVKGFLVGRVLASKTKAWHPGDFIGTTGAFTSVQVWDEEALKNPRMWRLTGLVDETTASLGVGALGMPGRTAWGGVLDVLRPVRAKKRGEANGEVFFVNAASGAVGQLAGQIAKSRGAQVIGSAGGPEKCKLLTEKFGFDHAIDYKQVADADALVAKLKELAPDGIDMYFENVGGMFFDATLRCIKPRGRLGICGCISGYNTKVEAGAKASPAGGHTNPLALGDLIYPQIRIEGFVASEWIKAENMRGFLRQMSGLIKTGKIQISETVTNGLENFGESFGSLFTGANSGKVVVKVGDFQPLWKPKAKASEDEA